MVYDFKRKAINFLDLLMPTNKKQQINLVDSISFILKKFYSVKYSVNFRDPLVNEIEEIEEEQSQEMKELEEIDELIRNAQAEEKSQLKKFG